MDGFHCFSLPFDKILVCKTSFVQNSSISWSRAFRPCDAPWHMVLIPSNHLLPDCQSPDSDGKNNTGRGLIPGRYPADRSSSGQWLTGRDWSVSFHKPWDCGIPRQVLIFSTVIMKSRLVILLSFSLQNHGQI